MYGASVGVGWGGSEDGANVGVGVGGVKMGQMLEGVGESEGQ